MSYANHLPDHLRERVVALSSPDRAHPDGEYVLYWAHHALRAHENPALETAAALAILWDRPLLIYQGLGGRHRYNADRHHRFILEAASDFATQLAALGLRLTFSLPADPTAPSPLRQLTARASAIVSEIFPVPPFPRWYRGHAEANPQTPFITVDTSCVYPMPLGKKRDRAFVFRKAAQGEYDRRLSCAWPEPDAWPGRFDGDVGFKPFDFNSSFDEAIAACAIDHSLPPVADTPGGSAAGYRRWGGFRDQRLARYAARRNDAADPHAVSRLSPYLHYGCVSPLRIAREAAATGGKGAEKFLDELLIWRELSHHFCCHTDELEELDVLPRWARETLLEHAESPRDHTFDWEQLLRGATGSELWDLAQRSLLRRGELHNNLRMTWGKALAGWARNPRRALKLLIDLNHRLALDGNDPNSYGGLLWCLGLFDRPFEPPRGPLGSVRGRSVARHAKRLDIERYSDCVAEPATGRPMRIVVVGAGLSGLVAARTLQDQGHEVTVIERGRGPGGRMSTRRDGELRFDHGAQYFTARDPRFLRHVVAWRERGLVDEWQGCLGVLENNAWRRAGDGTTRYVAVPGMGALCAELAEDLDDVAFNQPVTSVDPGRKGRLRVAVKDDEREADAVILAMPPNQASQLLSEPLPQAAREVDMQPVWALMAEFREPLLEDWDGGFINGHAVSWMARQASKPGRPEAQCWVVHATPDWSAPRLDAPPNEVTSELLELIAALPGVSVTEPRRAIAHRWSFALARRPLNCGAICLLDQRLILAGDWCGGSRVEGAFLSGQAAAGRVMASAGGART